MCSFNIAVHTESLCEETGVITTTGKWLFCPPKKKTKKLAEFKFIFTRAKNLS